MQFLKHPTFLENWREAAPEERAELVFVLALLLVVVTLMVASAAIIGWLIALVGWPSLGISVATALFTLAAINMFGR
jgi:hypothetical protein